jgi:hypothetical protein
LSQEHLFSQPICNAIGLTRDAVVPGRLDARDGPMASAASLGRFTVRLPCSACNSGWMSDLERAAAAHLRRWLSSDEPLGRAGWETLAAWMLKTYFAAGHVEAHMRHPLKRDESGKLTYVAEVIPEPRRAKALSRRDYPTAFDNVTFGAARAPSGGPPYLYAFGNPTVHPSGPHQLNSRTAGVIVITLGPVELWATVAPLSPERVTLPARVSPLTAHSQFRELRIRGSEPPYPTAVVVSYARS